jgi:hypothetical protein
MSSFAKCIWRKGDRVSALQLMKWSKYIATASIVLGIVTLVAFFSLTRGGSYNNGHRSNNVRNGYDRDCYYYGNC